MSELLKDIYDENFLYCFGEKVRAVYDAFDIKKFVARVMDETWENLALKARTRRITQSLGAFLPRQYEDALDILFELSESCVGFPYLFFPDFVALYGQKEEHWELSMKALEAFTQKSSSEFAIRGFLIRDSVRTISRMLEWAKHPNEHVRRLASEGCRPRLPWGEAIKEFKTDPAPVLSILEVLKADISLYVRKSVANNLNDISKDHPEIVLETAKRWKGEHNNTDWIIRQGCRTLIKKAYPGAMALFGYTNFKDGDYITTGASILVQPSMLTIGESCELQYKLDICEGKAVHIRIEYGIDFIKARGNISRKLFLLSDKTVLGGTHISGTRTHSWEDLTTRKHYPGKHRILLVVNGQEVASTLLEVKSR